MAQWFFSRSMTLCCACLPMGCTAAFLFNSHPIPIAFAAPVEAGSVKRSLPYYTKEDVASHNSLRDSVWVTYKAGVYDITPFVRNHPGGEKRIMLAAGSSIDKYWEMFTIHDDDAVREILEKHRIGNLKNYKPLIVDTQKMWENEPTRSPALKVLKGKPFSAETPEGVLDEFITPNDLFFVRNHMPVPDLREKHDFCLQVEGEGIVPRCFSVEELKNEFPEHTVVTTIQCGGNRRTEFATNAKEKAVKGLEWTNGGISTTRWTGVWLRDVIKSREKGPPSNPAETHVQFEGADKDAAGNFHVSIPYPMAINPQGDVLIAFKMNGVPIPLDHGFPLRAIVPGAIGVRNCKWLQRITLQPFESQSVWQQNDYKNFPPWETRPNPSYSSVYYMPVQSAITDARYNPASDAIEVKGYAYCGGGTPLDRVELSFDGGNSFETLATLHTPPADSGIVRSEDNLGFPSRRAWSWRQFSAAIPAEDIKAPPREAGEGSLFRTCSRAITKDNSVQPKEAAYNFRGLLYNGYSCRDIIIE